MRLDDEQEDSNFEDRRGQGFGGGPMMIGGGGSSDLFAVCSCISGVTAAFSISRMLPCVPSWLMQKLVL